jgi:parallel beta-helix repeat protein
VDADGDDLVFDGLDVRSTVDAAAYPTWGKAKWEAYAIKGFQSRGDRVTVKNSTFMGFGYAMVLLGPQAKAIKNEIRGFGYDGLRVFGAKSILDGNLITDCVRFNSNHPDAIQSWPMSGDSISGLVLENNSVIEWSNPSPSRLRCQLQGIGFFDGFYDNLVIRNNVISVTAYHGISVYGARNAEIINNTVVNGKGNVSSYPWIGVFKHKNGSPSKDVMVANNLAMGYHGKTNVTNRRTYTANSTITAPARVFTDVTKFNYLPKTDSGFVDNGEAAVAPKVDIRSYKRPAGKGPDRGAYETGSTPSSSTSSSTTTSTQSTQTAVQQQGTY